MKEEVEKRVKRELLYARILTGLGLVTLILALLNVQRVLMIGLTAGFLPVGLLSWYAFKEVKKDRKTLKKLEASNDERNTFVRLKAGYLSFWTSLWLLFALVMVNNLIQIPFLYAGIALMIFMSISYFVFLWHYNNRY